MILGITVYMDQRDVTKWVEAVSVRQSPHCFYREATITFRGWTAVDSASRWDVYATTDAGTPRSSLLLSGGIIPPDRPPSTVVDGGVPVTTVSLYDWAWIAQRRMPRSTIIMAPTRSEARVLALRSEEPLGSYQVIEARTMHQVVRALAEQAGINVDLRIPDYFIQATVFDLTKTLWEDIYDLVGVFSPEVYSRSNTNTIAIVDRIARTVGAFGTINIPAAAVKSATVSPLPYRRLRRILVQIPRWL